MMPHVDLLVLVGHGLVQTMAWGFEPPVIYICVVIQVESCFLRFFFLSIFSFFFVFLQLLLIFFLFLS